MTVQEAMKWLHVSKAAVIQMVQTGRLRAETITQGTWRYDIDSDALQEFMRTHEYREVARGGRWVKK